MYAIIQTGGKQYRIEKGDVIEVELLGVDKGPIDFKEVLFYSDDNAKVVGTPYVTNCFVKGDIIKEIKGPKVIAFKYKRRQNYHRKVGHRQQYAQVKITDIVKEG